MAKVVLDPKDARALSEKFTRALQAERRSAAPLIAAWQAALAAGLTGYRSTLKLLGIDPSGYLYAGWTIAKAVTAKVLEYTDDVSILPIQHQAMLARDLLRASKPPRPGKRPLELAGSAVAAILSYVAAIERPKGERPKRVAFPAVSRVPAFNARELIVARLLGQPGEIRLVGELDPATVKAAAETAVEA